MCGITGIVLRGHNVDPTRLDAMTDALAHRGPDGRGTWVHGNVGLGHRLLRIVGECPQPVEMGDCVLTYNGEVYGIPGSLSDTARLIPLYWKHGFPWMLHELNGMFAFCLYDQRTGELYLARDRFGEKPLYYVLTDDSFLFASEIKALLEIARPRGINEEGLAEYERYGQTLGDRTLYTGVRKLEPGHALIFNPEAWRLSKIRYWKLPAEQEELRKGDEGDLLDLIRDAVAIRTRADTPWGCYLSGGIDSSFVACLARPTLAFNGDFEPEGYSEEHYARIAAHAAGAYLQSGRIWREDLEEVVDEVVWHMDEPAAGVGALPQYLIARMAAEKVKVVLSGHGGDEIFGGYGRYADLAGVPRPIGYENYVAPEQYRDLTLDSAQRWDIENFLPGLLQVEDRVNMAFGLESRAPLLDHRIAEFVFMRPPSWRMRNGQLKGLLREIARGIVPDPILDRTDKLGFPTPWITDWRRRALETWHRVYAEERLAA